MGQVQSIKYSSKVMPCHGVVVGVHDLKSVLQHSEPRYTNVLSYLPASEQTININEDAESRKLYGTHYRRSKVALYGPIHTTPTFPWHYGDSFEMSFCMAIETIMSNTFSHVLKTC